MYVGFKIIIDMDGLFLKVYPDCLVENLHKLNNSGILRMTKDYNSTSYLL